MRVAILGPLVVERDGAQTTVAGDRLQALLARLALDPGRPVSRGALVETLWDGDSPRDEQHALQSLVSRLRRSLGDPGLVVQEAAGYRLAVERDDVDVVRFERLAREGADALSTGDTIRAERLLDEALALWRGPPVLDADRLAELRLNAAVDRLTAISTQGRMTAHLAELTELAAEHPLDERLGVLRIRALAAAGRQADALAAYEAIRNALDEALGAAPSAELQAAHLAVLRGEIVPEPRRPAGGNLPAARTSFVGREPDLERARELLTRHRLVTLVGTGGAGKTRLAVELASRSQAPAWLVELASLGDGDALAPAMLGALGLQEAALPDRRAAPADDESRLLDALAGAEALIVLDNCEHIVAAAARLADRLLASCPRLRILATSREPLAIDGEALAPVGPLAEEAAVRLFADRAASASPGFSLDDATRPIVADVCARIDGLPLAIELAAARLRSMPLGQLSDRLHDRFRLLTGGSRAAAGRQRTLRAVVDWSWDLLTEPERRLARRLSVFPSGATLDAAEAVCSGDGVESHDVFDLLCALVDRSLLQVAGAEETRWRMLETIREYAEEEAERAGELLALREGHARHFAALVERADRHLRGAEQLTWLTQLRADRDNILTALRFLGEAGEAGLAVRTTVRLLWFWALSDGRQEAQTWLRLALESPGDADPLDRMLAEAILAWSDEDARTPDPTAAIADALDLLDGADVSDRPLLAIAAPVIALISGHADRSAAMLDALEDHPDSWVRAMAALARAQMAENDGRLGDMDGHLAASLERFRATGDRWGTAVSLSEIASLRMLHGDLDGAAAALEESDRLLAELGSRPREGLMVLRRAELLSRQGDCRAARELLERALEDATGHEQRLLLSVFLAILAARMGDREAARVLREDALAEVRRGGTSRLDHAHQRAIVFGAAAKMEVEEGAIDLALEHALEAYAAAVESRDMPIAGRVGEAVAALAHRAGRPQDAAEMLGASLRLRGTDDPANPETAAFVAALREALGEEALAAGVAAGRALDRDAALARIDPGVLDAASVRA